MAIKASLWVAAAFAITQWGLFKVQRATRSSAGPLPATYLRAVRNWKRCAAEIMESGASGMD